MTQRKTDRVETQSAHPLDERLEHLKQLYPEAVTEDGIDFDALRNLLGIEFPQKERYQFTWAGKQEALLSLQKRSKGTLKPVPEESVNWDSTGHLFIEGDNLEVLKLLYKSYFGRVKMIYIDPPYNTGNDFVYPDNYTDPLGEYLRMTAQVDEQGNLQVSRQELNGRKHSAWLSMMYPRLFLARQLLQEDGLLFVSIDDRELSNLRLLLNEIFGEENFVGSVVWKRRQNVDSRTKTGLSSDHEYAIIFRKNDDARLRGQEKDLSKYSNPDNDPRGAWSSDNLVGLATKDQRPNLHYELVNPDTGHAYECPEAGWRYSRQTMARLIADGRILWPSSLDGRPRLKRFLNELTSEYTGLTSVIDGVYSTTATLELKKLFDGRDIFDFPKPSEYIKMLIQQGTTSDGNDIILDFFAGSSTTAHAVMSLNREDAGNRHFIMVQFPEPTDNPDYPTIADIGKERIRRVIQRMIDDEAGKLEGFEQHPDEDLGFRVFKLDSSAMRQWEDMPASTTTPEEYARQLEMFVKDPLLEGWTIDDVIAEVAIKETGFSLSYRVEQVAEVTELTLYRVIDDEKEQFFYICLDDKLSLDALKPLNLQRDDLLIFRDSAVTDTIVANLVLTCRIKSI